MYWCIKTINYLEASTLNDQLIKEGLETLRSCPLRNFWRETALLIDVMWPRSNQYKTAVLRKKFQLYNKIMSLFCTYYSKGNLPETLAQKELWLLTNSMTSSNFTLKKKYFYTFTVSCPICESHLHISFNPVVLKNLSITNHKVLKYAPKNSLHAHFKIRVYMSK